ncbi:MAG TPA: 5-(carboxyamino)imidazole ribonucleotide synthase [Thermoanaerobaculia bacterium]|nr:5-(carboxyamino)imidazole ribonucleotide synthase [Thermoanaerobaculia bacterium]
MTAGALPGATIGVLGSGQLGRMFAIAARRMGYRVHTFSPDYDTPTGQVADIEVTAPYDDLDRVREFAKRVDVVTFEFENVSAAAASAAAEHAPVRPDGNVLFVCQHRVREKAFLSAGGFPVAPYRIIRSEDDLERGIAELGAPAVLKRAGFSYDGKGQARVTSAAEAAAAWSSVGREEAVLEAFVEFDHEASIIVARGLDGATAEYALLRNAHSRHILDHTLLDLAHPAREKAIEIARAIAERLDLVGVLCVELFVMPGGALLVNELAPRPHNSGHLTIDACATSQFEQQLRTVCGLPLGSTRALTGAAMTNLLGDLWSAGEPDWAAACAFSEAKLHIYGKSEARPGRKMGHITALAADPRDALRIAIAARSALTRAVRS